MQFIYKVLIYSDFLAIIQQIQET